MTVNEKLTILRAAEARAYTQIAATPGDQMGTESFGLLLDTATHLGYKADNLERKPGSCESDVPTCESVSELATEAEPGEENTSREPDPEHVRWDVENRKPDATPSENPYDIPDDPKPSIPEAKTWEPGGGMAVEEPKTREELERENVKAVEPEAPKMSYEDARTALVPFVQAGVDIKPALKQFGAEKLSGVAESDLAAFVQAVVELANANKEG